MSGLLANYRNECAKLMSSKKYIVFIIIEILICCCSGIFKTDSDVYFKGNLDHE